MSVLARPKLSEGVRRRRQGLHRGPEPAVARPEVAAEREHRRPDRACAGLPLTNDQAMYACGCGFVFQAPVSTSVGCPHCGGTQAW